jgi:multidrug efflux system membrane fusion protein
MDEQVGRLDPDTPPARVSRAPALAAPRARRRRGWLWAAALVAGVVLIVLAWREFAPQPASSPNSASRPAQAAPQPVAVATAAASDLRVIVNALGTVTPLATVTVKTQLAGQLQQIGFKEGQLVRKGDFLAQIDPRPYQAALEQFQGQLARDQALLKQAQADLGRYQTLLKQDSIARQQADDQVYLVQQYQGAIRSDQAQIDTQQLNLTYCRIVAPVDGRVGLRQVDAGNYVQNSDANGIVVITQLQPISVLFSIAEDNLPSVQKRVRAGGELAVEAYDRANLALLATGNLATTDNQIDTTTGTVKLRAVFANSDETLFPNQFVNARLLVDTLRDVVAVPVAAIQRGAPGTYAYVVGANDAVAVRPLKVGVTDGDKIQVVSGLAVGEKVVVDGADRLREGARVSVQQAAAAAPPASGPKGGPESVAPEAQPPKSQRPESQRPESQRPESQRQRGGQSGQPESPPAQPNGT